MHEIIRAFKEGKNNLFTCAYGTRTIVLHPFLCSNRYIIWLHRWYDGWQFSIEKNEGNGRTEVVKDAYFVLKGRNVLRLTDGLIEPLSEVLCDAIITHEDSLQTA